MERVVAAEFLMRCWYQLSVGTEGQPVPLQRTTKPRLNVAVLLLGELALPRGAGQRGRVTRFAGFGQSGASCVRQVVIPVSATHPAAVFGVGQHSIGSAMQCEGADALSRNAQQPSRGYALEKIQAS